jgi:NAD(P)H dehydrogenase (quinone)
MRFMKPGPPKRCLVVFVHPVRVSFVGAMLDHCVEALMQRGDEVRLVDLYDDDFQPVLPLTAWHDYREGSITPEIQRYVDALRWANTLVFIYPTWFGAQPAMLKGWLDRVFVPGVAFSFPTGRGNLRPGLRHIQSVTVLTSHGSGKLMNSIQGEPGKRVALRGIRSLCSRRCRTSWIAFYGNDQATDADRKVFLQRVDAHFRPRSGRGRAVTGSDER